MGLSSLGNPKYKEIIKKNLFKNFNNLELNLNYFNHHKKNYSYNFSGEPNQSEIFNKNIDNLFNFDKNSKTFKEDIASSIQYIFEEILDIILKKCINLNFSKFSLCGWVRFKLSGKQKIFDKQYFDNIFIPYAPGDGGGSIGSSLYFLSTNKKNFDVENLKNPYIGPSFKNSKIKSIINEKKLINII